MSYFRPQKARKTGLRSIHSLLLSTQKVSQKGGRVSLSQVCILKLSHFKGSVQHKALLLNVRFCNRLQVPYELAFNCCGAYRPGSVSSPSPRFATANINETPYSEKEKVELRETGYT